MRHAVLAVACLSWVGLGLACGPAHVPIDADASEKRYLLGTDYYHKGLIAPALEELTKAVALNPENPDAHSLLGIIYLRKAAEIEDLATRSQCLKGEGMTLERQGADAELLKAEKEFREAIRLRNDFSEAHNALAVVAQHFGRFDEAIASAEKALTNITYTEPEVAQINLGVAYTSKGDLVRAQQQLQKAIFAKPKNCIAHWRLAQVYKQQGELERAKEEIDLLDAEKNCPIQEAYHLGGLLSLKLGDRDRAKSLFQRCVTLGPKSCLARECTLAGSP